MPCQDCLRNCDLVLPDRCVEYTGDDIACLGICKGDTLYEFEVAIAEKVCALLEGEGIDLSSITLPCEFLTDIQGTDAQTLISLINTLATAACTLKELVDAINAQLDITFSYDTACLTGLPTAPTRDDILQATILKLCADDVRITAIEADYVKNSDLCTLVTACLAGGGGGGAIEYKDRMVPYSILPYNGPLSNFDNTGKGLAAFGFDKIYLMNGLNSTQDWRGRSPIGAINNVPGGTLDAAVDPSIPANAGLNYNLNQKIGASSVTLAITQIPAHSHPISDPGHRHTFPGVASDGRGADGSKHATPSTLQTNTSLTGITVGSSGGSQSHTNLQPNIACYYITYRP